MSDIEVLLRCSRELGHLADFQFKTQGEPGRGVSCYITPRSVPRGLSIELFGVSGDWVVMIEDGRTETYKPVTADLHVETAIWASALGGAKWQTGRIKYWTLGGFMPRYRRYKLLEARPPWQPDVPLVVPDRLLPLRKDWCWTRAFDS